MVMLKAFEYKGTIYKYSTNKRYGVTNIRHYLDRRKTWIQIENDNCSEEELRRIVSECLKAAVCNHDFQGGFPDKFGNILLKCSRCGHEEWDCLEPWE